MFKDQIIPNPGQLEPLISAKLCVFLWWGANVSLFQLLLASLERGSSRSGEGVVLVDLEQGPGHQDGHHQLHKQPGGERGKAWLYKQLQLSPCD